jgi:hypothetical protein
MSECPGYILDCKVVRNLLRWAIIAGTSGLPRQVNLGWVGVQCQCEKNLSHEVAFHFGIKRFLVVTLYKEPSFGTSTEWRGEFWRFDLYT